MGALHYILRRIQEGIIPFSTITAKDLNEVKDRGDGLFWLVHPTSNRLKTEDSNTLDITYFSDRSQRRRDP